MRRFPNWLPDVLAAFALFLLNAAIVWPLFLLEYPADLSSIEGAFIGLARHLREHFVLTGWFPYWYGGIPFQNTYPPLSHALVAAWSWISGCSVALGYHQFSAVVYCLIPVALALLARSLKAPRWPAWAAGLFVSLASPSAWLIHPLAVDMGGWRYLRRFHVLTVYGENPNLTSLLFCLISLALIARALSSRRALWIALAAVACGGVALTNYLGSVVLGLGALALLLSQEDVFAARRWMRLGIIAALSYGLAAIWLPPSTVMAIQRNSPHSGGRYESSAAVYVYAAIGLALVFVLLWAFRAMGASRALRFAALWSVCLGGIVLLAAKLNVQLLPQAMRYHIAMELALAMLIVLGGCWFFREALRRPAWSGVYLAVMLALGALQLPIVWSYARSLVRPGNASRSIEAETVRWVEEHLPGQRVFLPGSVSEWADAFGDVVQFGGGFEIGAENPSYLAVNYQIYSSANAGERAGEIAVTWLKAYGVRAVQVSLPESPEYLRVFEEPLKFEGLLAPLWDHRGMRTYRVPARQDGLAFVVPEAALPVRQPENGLDVEEARLYVAALDDASLPAARFQWKSEGEAAIMASLSEGQAISVQLSYHPGWEARSGGERLRVERDGLGQVILRPGPGTHQIHLKFTGGVEQVAVRAVSGFSLLVLAVLAIPPLRKKAARLPLVSQGIGRLQANRLL